MVVFLPSTVTSKVGRRPRLASSASPPGGASWRASVKPAPGNLPAMTSIRLREEGGGGQTVVARRRHVVTWRDVANVVVARRRHVVTWRDVAKWWRVCDKEQRLHSHRATSARPRPPQ